MKLEWRLKYGMEILHLGEIEVGRVRKDGGRKGRPTWMFNLEAHIAFWHDEATVEQAKAAVLMKMQNWLERAGIA